MRSGRLAIVALLLLASSSAAAGEPQLGALVSPGPLTRAHADLEGIRKCQSCHEAGQRVSANKCLGCHKPVAERMAAKKGLHRAVTSDCVSCHVEHMGLDAELRPLDTRRFDHSAETGFPLEGTHASLAATCASCHKTRSFLTLSPACSSCHQDVHRPSLGAQCSTCHSTQVAFKAARQAFDHARARFPLSGAHREVACSACHVNQQFKGLTFSQCSDCHKDPHQPSLASPCASCHTTESWRTRRIDHAKTAFPLRGKHASVECTKCHKAPALQVKPRADTCGTCHQDVHRGTFKQDCRTCHTEAGFARAPFDHTTTAFRLTGRHERTPCEACHKGTRGVATQTGQRTVDFRGLSRQCTSCHNDPHQQELGLACERCHSTETFRVPAFTHASPGTFFAGSHASVPCGRCHAQAGPSRQLTAGGPATARVRYTTARRECASCHRDVHLGQVTHACESCHAIDIARFQLAPTFTHARTKYPLNGKHETVECRRCHATMTTDFPTGHGTAMRLTGMATECAACHTDTHLGQVGSACQTCHSTATFAVSAYTHARRAPRGFFVGRHVSAACSDCHRKEQGRFPAGVGTAIRFEVSAACATCHLDVHDGALGPQCGDCHKPEVELAVAARLAPAHVASARVARQEAGP